MNILLANSNTSPAVTAAILQAASAAAAPGTTVIGRNARFGPRVVSTRTEAAIAAHGLVDLLAEHGTGMDAVVIGMSLDTGVWAAREMLAIPVVGMTEAACLTACLLGTRFGLVVLGSRGLQPYREVVEGYGLGGRLAGLRSVEVSPQALLQDPEAVLPPIAAAATALAHEDGAEAVVLVGAVMANLRARLVDAVPVPLVEGIAAGIMLAETLVRIGFKKPTTGSLQAVPARESVELGPALAEYLSGRR